MKNKENNNSPDLNNSQISHFPLFAIKTSSLVKMREEYVLGLGKVVSESLTNVLSNCEFLVSLTVSKLAADNLIFLYITRRVDNVTLGQFPASFDEANFDINNKREITEFLNLIPFMFIINEYDILAFENKQIELNEYEEILYNWRTA